MYYRNTANKVEKNIKHWRYGIIAGAIFGIYSKALMAIQWDASIFDLLGATFLLLTLFFYIKYAQSKKYNYFYMAVSILCYYLGLRTKEMILCLPIIIAIYEQYMNYCRKRKIRLSIYSITMNTIMLLYSLLLFSLKSVENITESTANPYFQSFNIFKMLIGIVKYILLYFDLKNPSFTYSSVNGINICGLLLIICIIFYGIYNIIKKKDFLIIVSSIAVGFSLLPVLPMINMQHVLYLYIPSIFISITCAVTIMTLSDINTNIWLIIFMIILYLLSYTPGIKGFREYWIELSKKDMQVIESIKSIPQVPPNTNIYLYGDNLDAYTVFYYGPGFINNLIFNDETIKTHINEHNATKVTPYVIWQYHENGIEELARDREISIEIQSIYPSEISNGHVDVDGNIAIGVTGINLTKNSIITVAGKELETVYSEEFISCIIPKEFIEGKNNISIYVKDAVYNTNSNSINVPIIGLK